ncbi:MAG: signal peptidase II [Longimicrobiales bacterium]
MFVLDLVSKRWALAALDHGETIHLLGGILPVTLAFNTGMVFGITVRGVGRGAVLAVTIVILALLVTLLRRGHRADPYRSWGVGLAAGGAMGNLFDRLRWTRGVVDFLGPIDLGFMLWPIFNLADVAIVTGALLVAASFGWEERVAEEGGADVTS